METMDYVNIIISLFGGVALFLYGMSILGNGLEKLSSGHMEKILEKLTNNILKSVALGAVVTALIQSSGATTVIVVGLVNAGVLKLSSAVGVIMGANIGTTVTGQILRLGDLDSNAGVNNALSMLSTKTLAPTLAIIGILFYMICKKDSFKTVGEILIALGLIFTGMISLTEAVSPLAELEAFKQIFASLSNPILGVLAGAIVTVLVQSSSASVGILQAISTTGVLKFSAAFPIIMGQNIGTCSTSIVSSIGASKNAKRAAMVHLYFNVIGTLLFLTVVYVLQYTVGLSFWNDSMDMGSIANFHTVFNVVVTVFFIPFHTVLEKLAEFTIRNTASSEEDEFAEGSEEIALDDRFLKSPSIAIQQAVNLTVHMGKLAQHNFRSCRQLFHEYDTKAIERIKECEEVIDKIEDKLNSYLVAITKCQISEAENQSVTSLLHLTSEFERIGDYSINLMESAMNLESKQIKFSSEALEEFDTITNAIDEIVDMAVNAVAYNNVDTARNIEPLEETIDDIDSKLKARHIERLKTGQCVIDGGVIFLDALTDLERIADHCSNIGVYVINKGVPMKENVKRHEYIQEIHKGESAEYRDAIDNYQKKYQI
ncbi:MAG: Na/Pi cotransporter family protein [Oscillospiraceae bacterium]